MWIFKKYLLYRRLKKRTLTIPNGLKSFNKIHHILKTPEEVWFWAMYMVNLRHPDSDPERTEERTPQEVIKSGQATPFELIDTIAYIMYSLGWKAIVVRGAKDTKKLFTHPSQYFVLYSFMNVFYSIDKDIVKIGSNLEKAFDKEMNYVATDWTGEKKLFAVVPRSNAPLRVTDEFDPIQDMP